MKPSYTAAYVVLTFDILTRETAFQTEGGVVGRLRYFFKKKKLIGIIRVRKFP